MQHFRYKNPLALSVLIFENFLQCAKFSTGITRKIDTRKIYLYSRNKIAKRPFKRRHISSEILSFTMFSLLFVRNSKNDVHIVIT